MKMTLVPDPNKADGANPLVEGSSGAFITEDVYSHECHAGIVFRLRTVIPSLSASGTYAFALVVPPAPFQTHAFAMIEVPAETDFRLYENSTLTNFGTPMPIPNANRNLGNNSQSSLYAAPTVSNYGQLYAQSHVGSGKVFGGETIVEQEIILKQSGTYVGLVNNVSNQSEWVSIQIQLHEYPQ